MSQADRLAKQQEAAGAQAAEFLRLRAMLAPQPMAVYVANCFKGSPRRWHAEAAHWVFEQQKEQV